MTPAPFSMASTVWPVTQHNAFLAEMVSFWIATIAAVALWGTLSSTVPASVVSHSTRTVSLATQLNVFHAHSLNNSTMAYAPVPHILTPTPPPASPALSMTPTA